MKEIKHTLPATESAHQNTLQYYSIAKSVKLTPSEYTDIEKLIPESSNQFRRMVKHLASNPDTRTTQLCIACASVNLSDVARKHNDLIESAGFYVSCYKPPYRINNRFGEPSNQYLWGLYCIGGDK